MRKFLYHLFILVGLFFSPLSHAQIVLEALEKPTGCSAIPSFHPFHKVTRGNYKWDGTFADPYTGEDSAYMTWSHARQSNLVAGYHLPTYREWLTIVPNNEVWHMGNNSTRLDVSESHQFGKRHSSTTIYKNFKGDYYKSNDGTLYGIRFKPDGPSSEYEDNKYVTAYRYTNLPGAIKIDIKYIGASSVSLMQVSDPSFWDGSECTDAFYFIKAGYYNDRGIGVCDWGDDGAYEMRCYSGGRAYYWLDDWSTGNYLWWDNVDGYYAEGNIDYWDTIRLFKD